MCILSVELFKYLDLVPSRCSSKTGLVSPDSAHFARECGSECLLHFSLSCHGGSHPMTSHVHTDFFNEVCGHPQVVDDLASALPNGSSLPPHEQLKTTSGQ